MRYGTKNEQNTVGLVVILMVGVTSIFMAFAGAALCYRFFFQLEWWAWPNAHLIKPRPASCSSYSFIVSLVAHNCRLAKIPALQCLKMLSNQCVNPVKEYV